MTTQEKYEKYNETVAPSEELIEKTREAMLAAASEAPVKKRNGGRAFGRVMSYVGVAAASVLITVAALRMPQISGFFATKNAESADMAADMAVAAEAPESAAPMNGLEEAATEDATEETAEEFADIEIFYVEDGEIKSDEEYLSCSVEEVFGAWANKNAVADVKVESVTLDGGTDTVGVQIDFSENLREQMDDEGLMLSSLTQTLAGYLNADGMVLTCGGEAL